ncbi:tannase/feruloyl esterase family alpha/beta hydrolase [Pseudoduganella namucuonensis]|uniref:Feruloyl esterase n=1 Tax=Pseudoduganella namucuonensis TaxID=1035707 RepID=A0A1I7L7K1_9BURK|nr:tannase/feruloyl esterase family alpha/beta hydrolase [Pseudoduganella namucuonensis]SFV05691.1 feruloyl esterase [Pseudoduganella namucuonensis]
MHTTPNRRLKAASLGLAAAAAIGANLAACGSSGGAAADIPRLAAAVPGTLASCADLAAKAAFPNTSITSATLAPAGSVTQTLAGVATAMPEHCVVLGKMNQRTSAVDGKSYAIGFEMRLPTAWNGRFFYQANGGNDGSIAGGNGAYGNLLGGSPVSNALLRGYAVISSDAGHVPDPAYPSGINGQTYGLDPQARSDYGYNAVGQLTPMAKNLIKAAYGRVPDRSYFVGCSNGGRHGFVAASRYADQYDGILAGNPGFNLPKAAVAEMWDNQAFAAIAPTGADGLPNIAASFSNADLKLVSDKVLGKCDALDGVADGMVGDPAQCQSRFSLAADVPTCAGAPDGTCLTAPQKATLAKVFGGPKNAAGAALYSTWPMDAGVGAQGWRDWKLGTSPGPGRNVVLGAPSLAYIFSTPPASPQVVDGSLASLMKFTLGYSFETDAPKIFATGGVFTESAMTFMTAPNPADLSALRNRGAKMMVFHGVSDPVFSYDDTVNWYQALDAKHGGDARAFARVYPVPGMNHCSGGPATDQFDMMTALVNWVEQGQAPDSVRAVSRTAALNNGLGAIPANRSRPLCAYPKVAKYNGGSIEEAASFSCQ